MALGPIEVLVVAFPGNDFNGQIIPELERLVESDTIALIDGLFIRKDPLCYAPHLWVVTRVKCLFRQSIERE